MSEINEFAAFLGIEPTAVSKRLVFVKSSALDVLWHIADYSLLVESDAQNKDPFIMALHGAYLPMPIKADSLTSVSLQEKANIRICESCVEEFLNALDLIQKNPQTRFVAFRTVFDETHNADKPIGNL